MSKKVFDQIAEGLNEALENPEDHRLIKTAKSARDGNVAEAIPEKDYSAINLRMKIAEIAPEKAAALWGTPGVITAMNAYFNEAILAEREASAKIAEDWEGPEKLLPMCSDEYNEVAAVGMHEAAERISEAIRRR